MRAGAARSQFGVLYREFLFSIVDLELVATRGDTVRLLGQLAAMLGALSLLLAIPIAGYAQGGSPRSVLLMAAWPREEFLIATTMMVVGLFAVLSWDSMFLSRRDILVLAPLPIRMRTLFLAKMAALGASLSLVVITANIFTGLTHPFVLAPGNGGVPEALRCFAAYWLTMFAAAAFVLCSVLTAQGLASQLLPRRHFLRFSSFLQMAAFCLNLGVYFLDPLLARPEALSNPQNRTLLAWLPSYWFLGLFHRLNGSMHPAFGGLDRRAVAGLACVVLGAIAILLLSYWRTLRQIVDEPDIVPGSHRTSWLPRFGGSLRAAVVGFSVRTLLRSRQHRLMLAGYLGIGLAISLAYGRSLLYGRGGDWRQVNAPLLIGSVVMLSFAVVGTRVVFAMPLALKANWVFRTTAVRGAPEYIAAIRGALLVIAVAPVWVVSAGLFLSIWPVHVVLAHLVALGLLGSILSDLCLHNFQKIPFTCSYLPGKANVHVTSGACAIVLLALAELGVQAELRALNDATSLATLFAVLGLAAIWARRRTAMTATSTEAALQFEESPPAEIIALELHRDGTMPQ